MLFYKMLRDTDYRKFRGKLVGLNRNLKYAVDNQGRPERVL